MLSLINSQSESTWLRLEQRSQAQTCCNSAWIRIDPTILLNQGRFIPRPQGCCWPAFGGGRGKTDRRPPQPRASWCDRGWSACPVLQRLHLLPPAVALTRGVVFLLTESKRLSSWGKASPDYSQASPVASNDTGNGGNRLVPEVRALR